MTNSWYQRNKGFMAGGVSHSKTFVEWKTWEKRRKPTGHRWTKNPFVQLAEFTQPLKKKTCHSKKSVLSKALFVVLGRVNPSSQEPPCPILLPMVRIHRRSQPFSWYNSSWWSTKRLVKWKDVFLGQRFGNFIYIHYICIHYYTMKKKVDWIAAFCQIKTIQRQFVSPPPIEKS